MNEYPVVSGVVRFYGIGFTAQSSQPDHDLSHLTRIIEAAPFDSVLKSVLVEDGSGEVPRLKTRVRSLPRMGGWSCELHLCLDESKTAEETFAQVSDALAKHGWSCEGGPA